MNILDNTDMAGAVNDITVTKYINDETTMVTK